MRDEMRQGDAVLFYHSSTTPTAVVGTATIVSQAYPDVTAWDPQSKYYDPKSSPDNPAWLVVDIKAEQEFARPVTLAEIKQNAALGGMLLVRRGMRLSVQPVYPGRIRRDSAARHPKWVANAVSKSITLEILLRPPSVAVSKRPLSFRVFMLRWSATDG